MYTAILQYLWGVVPGIDGVRGYDEFTESGYYMVRIRAITYHYMENNLE